jgi:sugar lactone lactonase YvrE
METWVDVTTLGARGDDQIDDTEAIKKAIAQHKAIYFPTGIYRVTDTLVLKRDTVLIGLNPITTQLALPDATPGYQAESERSTPFAGAPKPLLETPKGGANIVTGLGLDSGGNNPAAVAAKWMAGETSMMDDVKFVGGHGSNLPNYNQNRTGDANPSRKWDSQYPSLWVTDGGGGTFKNLWTASTFAAAGMLVTDTETEGRVYQMSTEHHVRNEIQLRRVKNWHFIALQGEEERGESSFALPIEIDRCENITFANLNLYRVVSVTQPFPYAVKVSDSKNIRFRNVHCYSNSKVSFDNLLFDATHDFELRQREFATLTLTSGPLSPRERAGVRVNARGSKRSQIEETPRSLPLLAGGGQGGGSGTLRLKPESLKGEVENLAGGFHNISGGAVHPNGDFYFVDPKWHRIHRWNVAKSQVELVHDAPLHPVNLAFDQAGNLIVLSYAGRGVAYTFRPDAPGEPQITLLKPESTQARKDKTFVFPVTDWLFPEAIVRGEPHRRSFQIPSPDGTTYLPVGHDFVDGTLTWGVKLQDALRSFGLARASKGKPFYITGESEMRTYAVTIEEDGTMTRPRLFAEQGGESVVEGPDGHVYIAAGQIYVYTPDGRQVETIEVPERPTHLAFGGKDGKTLFITARTGLYAVRR